jgi:hypothetical protein
VNTFEELLSLAKTLRVPEHGNQRVVEWCDADRVLGLARQQGGAYELFIATGKLTVRSAVVERHLRHDRWKAGTETEFEANRLVLPAENHFVPVAAFLVEELLRNGVSASPQNAFTRVEPLIDLALRRTALDEETIVGLIGELMFLEVLLAEAETVMHRATCLESWRGYEPSRRDFVFIGRADVEVKVTRGVRSSHEISSLSQVDPRRTEDGTPIEQLYLLSIGLRTPAADEVSSARSLPRQVDAVLRMLGPNIDIGQRNEIQELFLTRVHRYGTAARRGYSHDEMKAWEVYQPSWIQQFARAYDMNSAGIDVLRLAEVEQHRHVSAGSVTYVADLPDSVDSTPNPRVDLKLLAAELIR